MVMSVIENVLSGITVALMAILSLAMSVGTLALAVWIVWLIFLR
jgi:hypothetical protein